MQYRIWCQNGIWSSDGVASTNLTTRRATKCQEKYQSACTSWWSLMDCHVHETSSRRGQGLLEWKRKRSCHWPLTWLQSLQKSLGWHWYGKRLPFPEGKNFGLGHSKSWVFGRRVATSVAVNVSIDISTPDWNPTCLSHLEENQNELGLPGVPTSFRQEFSKKSLLNLTKSEKTRESLFTV